MQHHYIQDDQRLISFCSELAHSTVLAIDTEFVRTRTFYPKLGLLQVCNGKQLALIDPITIKDLSPFWRLLIDKNIIKVLHACSEDLEVFITACSLPESRCKPVNLIDSQIMMSFLGHGLSIGYAAMVQKFTGIELDKSESRTDWTKRPLTSRQLTYASADVEYLFTIYPQLVEALKKVNRLDFAKEETQLLIERKYKVIDEKQLYKNSKIAWRLNSSQLNTLKYLTAWRFSQAKKRNLPLGFVVKDNTLVALALHQPKTLVVMKSIEAAEVLDIRHQGKAMLAVILAADAIDSNHYPEKIMRLDEYPGYKNIFKKVKDFIIDVGKQHDIAIENLSSKKQINQFLTWKFNINNAQCSDEVVDILSGWRLALFGKKLQSFVDNNFNNPDNLL